MKNNELKPFWFHPSSWLNFELEMLPFNRWSSNMICSYHKLTPDLNIHKQKYIQVWSKFRPNTFYFWLCLSSDGKYIHKKESTDHAGSFNCHRCTILSIMVELYLLYLIPSSLLIFKLEENVKVRCKWEGYYKCYIV